MQLDRLPGQRCPEVRLEDGADIGKGFVGRAPQRGGAARPDQPAVGVVVEQQRLLCPGQRHHARALQHQIDQSAQVGWPPLGRPQWRRRPVEGADALRHLAAGKRPAVGFTTLSNGIHPRDGVAGTGRTLLPMPLPHQRCCPSVPHLTQWRAQQSACASPLRASVLPPSQLFPSLAGRCWDFQSPPIVTGCFFARVSDAVQRVADVLGRQLCRCSLERLPK